MPERIHLPNFLTKNPPNTARVMRPSMWGKNLACTCLPGACCHGDVLLEIANR